MYQQMDQVRLGGFGFHEEYFSKRFGENTMILAYSLYQISPAGREGREGGRERGREGIVVIALASHQRDAGSIMDSWTYVG